MKKYVILLAVAVSSLLGYGQMNQVVWLNGRAVVAQSISQIDSLKYGEIEGGDTLHLVLPRVVVVHDTVVKTVYVNYCVEEDALKGGFSVAADKQVRFSKGNLQYVQSTKTWGFAEHQYDMIGSGNITTNASGENVLADTIDLFGWSSDNTAVSYGVSSSSSSSEYDGTFVDWGNNIGDGNTWRTLSNDEWYYLFHTRTNAEKLIGLASVNGINGLVLLPDTWTCPTGIQFTSCTDGGYEWDNSYDEYHRHTDNMSSGDDTSTSPYLTNSYTLDEWSKMEAAGAVFLPAAGARYGLRWMSAGEYWASTKFNTNTGGSIIYGSSSIGPRSNRLMSWGLSVRLVQEL